MQKVWHAVYCTFKRSFSHGPALKPNQTKPIYLPLSRISSPTSAACLYSPAEVRRRVFRRRTSAYSRTSSTWGSRSVYHLKSDGGHPTKQKTGNFIFFLKKKYSCRKQNRETKEMRLPLDIHWGKSPSLVHSMSAISFPSFVINIFLKAEGLLRVGGLHCPLASDRSWSPGCGGTLRGRQMTVSVFGLVPYVMFAEKN